MVALVAKQAVFKATLANPSFQFNAKVKSFFDIKKKVGYIEAKKDGKFWYKIDDIETNTQNKFDNIIKSGQKLFKGDDTFTGSAFDDTLTSFAGADVVKAGEGGDNIQGGDGADRLWGQGGNDAVFGNAGADFLDGGKGINTLTGGDGTDHFQFTATLAAGNQSAITDFRSGVDTIELDRSAFTGIGGKGKLPAKSFFLYPDPSKSIEEHTVVYVKELGELWYSEEGSIIGASLFAKVTPGLDLSSKDFLIV